MTHSENTSRLDLKTSSKYRTHWKTISNAALRCCFKFLLGVCQTASDNDAANPITGVNTCAAAVREADWMGGTFRLSEVITQKPSAALIPRALTAHLTSYDSWGMSYKLRERALLYVLFFHPSSPVLDKDRLVELELGSACGAMLGGRV